MNNNLNSYAKNVFLPKAIADSGRTYQMKPLTMGLLDVKTQTLVPASEFKAGNLYQLVYKGTSKGDGNSMFSDKTGNRLTIRSLEFSSLDSIYSPKDMNYVPKPMIGYLGYDGISDCKTLSFPCGETFGLLVRVSGQTVRNVFGRDIEEIIPFTTDCCEDCFMDEKITKTLDTIRTAFDTASFYVKNYVKMEQVKSCCPAEAPFASARYSKFCITVCDAGDSKALADVQLQYQAFDITLLERKGTFTTYEVCLRAEFLGADDTLIAAAQATYDAALIANPIVQVDIDNALVALNAAKATAETNADAAVIPADFTTTGTVLSDCDTCPTGFTTVAASQKLVVTMPVADPSANALTTVQTVMATATSAVIMGSQAGYSTYEVLVPLAFDVTTTFDNVVYQKIGDVPVSCVQTTPSTTSWTKCGSGYKISRTLCMTKKNADCDATELAEVIAEYANDSAISGIAIRSTTNCNTSYTLTQENNACLEDGCDTYGKDGAKFDEVPTFAGMAWMECDCEGWTFDADGCPVAPAAVPVENCLGGLKFTGAIVDDKADVLFSINDAIERTPVIIEVGIVDIATKADICDQMKVDWTIVQRGQVGEGRGDLVARQEVMARRYDGQHYFDPKSELGLLMQEKSGVEYAADPTKLYTHVDAMITYNRVGQAAYSSATHNSNRELVKVFVEAGNTAFLEEVKTFFSTIGSKTGVSF